MKNLNWLPVIKKKRILEYESSGVGEAAERGASFLWRNWSEVLW